MLYVVQNGNGRIQIADTKTPNFQTYAVLGTFFQDEFALAQRFQAGCLKLECSSVDAIFHALGYDGVRRDAPGSARDKSLNIIAEFGW